MTTALMEANTDPLQDFPRSGFLQRAEIRFVSNSENGGPVFLGAKLPGLHEQQRKVTLCRRSRTEQHGPTINTHKMAFFGELQRLMEVIVNPLIYQTRKAGKWSVYSLMHLKMKHKE